MGGERISQFSYTQPRLFGQNIDFNLEEVCFYTLNEGSGSAYAAEMFGDKKKLKVNNLPSNCRLIIQVIMIPKPKYMYFIQRKLPNREGYIYGSIAMPIYDIYRRLK